MSLLNSYIALCLEVSSFLRPDCMLCNISLVIHFLSSTCIIIVKVCLASPTRPNTDSTLCILEKRFAFGGWLYLCVSLHSGMQNGTVLPCTSVAPFFFLTWSLYHSRSLRFTCFLRLFINWACWIAHLKLLFICLWS